MADPFNITTGVDPTNNLFDDILLGNLQNPDFVVKKNQQQYEFRVAFQNFSSVTANPSARSDFTSAQILNPQAIIELVINETLHEWNTSGYIVIESTLESFEKNPSDLSDVPKAYTMRMDCRDILLISILPLSPEGEKDGPGAPPKEQYLLKGEFVIYDTEDIHTEDLVLKAKKLYFHDLRYQLATEQRIQFSTNDSKIFSGADGRIDNEVETGTVLKRLLERCNDPAFGLGWGQIMKTSLENWDEGTSKVFFTAPANYTILDSMNYILDRHVSKLGTAPTGEVNVPRETSEFGTDPNAFTGEASTPFTFNGIEYAKSSDPARPGYLILSGPNTGTSTLNIPGYTPPASSSTPAPSPTSTVGSDLCVLTTNRFTDEFELMPFSKLFALSTEGNQPGKYQIEHMFIPLVSQIDSEIGLPRAPLASTNDWAKDVKLASFGYIANYRFVDFSGIDSAKTVLTRPVYSYDFKSHSFVCEFADHGITKTKEFLKANYVDNMYGGMAGKPAPLLTLNDMKKKQKVIEPVFSTKKMKESRLNDGRNKTLFSSIYLNEHIVFTTLGSTNRTSGRFIGIDTDNRKSIEEDNFSHRLLGQWLVTSVKHVFLQDSYINEIEAIKIQSYKDIKINESIP